MMTNLCIRPADNVSMQSNVLEEIEIQLLLEAIFRRYGFDFRDYAYPSISRRILNLTRAEGLNSISELQGKLLHDQACMERFLQHVTVHVTSMFRDPDFYLAFRRLVLPCLCELPFVRIWHVGCSTGEEVYSMAILLAEENLYSRCRIYATDMSEHVVAKAKTGIIALEKMPEYGANYRQVGGKASLSDYCTTRYGHAIIDRSLRENLVFSQHNLVTDSSFNEFHVILCRNVLIYFNNALCGRVHQLFHDSLVPGGFLGLGSKESLRFTPHESSYQALDGNVRIYRRVSTPNDDVSDTRRMPF
jgi:chemotaxis protein methyltransferase CheR